jgi:hypothetical protein
LFELPQGISFFSASTACGHHININETTKEIRGGPAQCSSETVSALAKKIIS